MTRNKSDKKSKHPLARAKPNGDRVIIKRDFLTARSPEGQPMTATGLLLPDSFATASRQTGVVVAVGPGKLLRSGKRMQMETKKGDHVIIAGYSGLAMNDPLEAGNDPDEDYVILHDEEILAYLPVPQEDEE